MPINDITKLLKFEGIKFISQKENENNIVLHFVREDIRPACPRCGSNKIHINDWRTHTAGDLPINNKPVKIHIEKQRYICIDCGKTVTGSLENIEPRKQHTNKVIPFLKEKTRVMTFKDCSKELSISPTTVMRLFKKNTIYYAPIECPNVVKKLWPETIIVADRFHYLRQVNWCVRDVRLRIQKSHSDGKKLKKYWKLFMMNSSKLSIFQKERLKELLSLDEDLKIVYSVKESFEKVIIENTIKAHEKFDNWLDYLQTINISEVQMLLGTFDNWYAEVTASFYYRYTNGIAEGINNKIKVIKRQAYGIRNFDNLRRLIMHRIS